jgi:hypothetical protein
MFDFRSPTYNENAGQFTIDIPIILIIYVTIRSTTPNHTETSRNLFANKFKVFDISFIRSVLQTVIDFRVKIVFNLRQLHMHPSLCCNNFLALRKQRKLLGTLVRTLIRMLIKMIAPPCLNIARNTASHLSIALLLVDFVGFISTYCCLSMHYDCVSTPNLQVCVLIPDFSHLLFFSFPSLLSSLFFSLPFLRFGTLSSPTPLPFPPSLVSLICSRSHSTFRSWVC